MLSVLNTVGAIGTLACGPGVGATGEEKDFALRN